MPIIRRFINAFATAVEQWIDDLDFIPTGRDHLEAQFKLALHLAFLRCSTVVHAFSFFILLMETQIFLKIYVTAQELSFMDYYYGFLIHAYWILLGSASGILIFSRRHSSLNFYNVIVMFALSLGTLFEYGWYYSLNEWLRDYEYCEICHDDRFPFIFFVKIIETYLSAASIHNAIIVYRQLKEHQQILDTITFHKFNTNAAKGG